MTLRNAQPVRFSPAGLSDSLDETDEFPGACSILMNLIPDTTTVNIWTPRPASTLLTSFAGFTTPGFISVFKVVGSYVYGMIATGRNAGKDEPFCWDLVNNVFQTVTNVTSANTPTSPATSGDWVPPTMDLIGVNLVVTHPGFVGTNGYFGWFDISTPSAPRWHSGNLMATGAIVRLNPSAAGTGGTPGTYLNVALTGGTGTGATADITIGVGGSVTAIHLDTFGSGFTVNDSLTATPGGLTGYAVIVSIIQTTGALTMTTPPTWVRQFYQRAYFGINPVGGQPSVILTDVLALGATNAGQALTFGDNTTLVAAAPIGLSNQLGGVIASLMVFKDDSNIAQITGDYAGSTLAINYVNVNTGTIAPRSLCQSPYGLLFMDHDGLRLLDFDARVGDPLGVAGKGVTNPFVNSLFPTRINASCNGSIVRISVQNGVTLGMPWQEYWYDLVRKVWSGPHTFPSVMADVYGSSFVIAPQSVTGVLFSSQTVPTSGSTYTENAVALTWQMQTVVLKDNQMMAESELAELQVKTSAVTSITNINVEAVDQNGSVLGSKNYSYTFGAASLWGSATWDISQWDSGSAQALAARKINFAAPVVYNRLAINITGNSAFGFQIGDIYLKERALGYVQLVD